jgi:hypothetical protein
MYETLCEVGNGSVTVQESGMGTMAGPPARGRMFRSMAGRAPTRATKAAVESKLRVVECSMLKIWRERYGSDRQFV